MVLLYYCRVNDSDLLRVVGLVRGLPNQIRGSLLQVNTLIEFIVIFFFFFWTCLYKRGRMIRTSDFRFIKRSFN
jgi:hypothetical protein